MKNRINSNIYLPPYTLLLFASLLSLFLIGVYSNIARYQNTANDIKEAYAQSGEKFLNVYATFENGEYDYDSLQTSISNNNLSGWPSNTFRELPLYNIDDLLGLKINNETGIVIANNDWNVHFSTYTGYTLTKYDFGVEEQNPTNDKGRYSNFCYAPESMGKSIGETINITYDDMTYTYLITNLIRDGVSTANGVEEMFGNNYIIANQEDITFKEHIQICNFTFNDKSNFLSITSFKNLINDNTASYHLQHEYPSKTIEFINEYKIIEALNRDVTISLPNAVLLLIMSVIFTALSMFLLIKGRLYLNKKNLLIISFPFGISLLVFGLIDLIRNSIVYLSFVPLNGVILLYVIYLLLFITKKERLIIQTRK
jgi:hypothetical protein